MPNGIKCLFCEALLYPTEKMNDGCFVYYNCKASLELSPKINAEILQHVSELNDQGMRVLAVAQKNNPVADREFSAKDEADMNFMGYSFQFHWEIRTWSFWDRHLQRQCRSLVSDPLRSGPAS